MLDKVEGWLLNVALGKLVLRLAVLIAAYVSGPVVQALAVKSGVAISIDPVKLQAELMALGLAAVEWFKARRAANPNSVAVQTDPSKPGADLSAVATVVK